MLIVQQPTDHNTLSFRTAHQYFHRRIIVSILFISRRLFLCINV